MPGGLKPGPTRVDARGMAGSRERGAAARIDVDGEETLATPQEVRPASPSVPVRFRAEPAPTGPSGRPRVVRDLLAGAPGVALVALVAGVAAYLFASQHDLMLLYADARSHLTIARRLIDGPNHGIVQLGTVWLPLPHVVLIPFVAIRSWWHSGAAAIPVDLACLVVEALAVFSLVRTVAHDRAAGWIAVAVLVTNPSVLYLHTTALTEPVLFASLLRDRRHARQVGGAREAAVRWRDRGLVRATGRGGGAVALRRVGVRRRGGALRRASSRRCGGAGGGTRSTSRGASRPLR